MKTTQALQSFAKALVDKGYTFFFHTQGAYPGRLSDSLTDYLESCRNGTEPTIKSDLMLTGYLQWSGESLPYIECNMWLRYHEDKFSLSRMEVLKKDRYGQLLKKKELNPLSVLTVPDAKAAIAMVSDGPQLKGRRPGRR